MNILQVHKIIRSGLLYCLAAGFLLSSCSPSDLTPASNTPGIEVTPAALGPGEIVVAAASDLHFAFTDISQRFEEQTGNHVTLVFGSTGHLTQQIENGAPYDVFAAASFEYIDRLSEQDLLLDDTIRLYGRGRLVLAANRGSGVRANTLEDLLAEQVRNISIANPDHAPYGIAARQALESAGLWEQLQGKLVLAENVRQALQYVQSGDAQVGLVALSIASVPEVSWMLVDQDLHEPLDQALAVTAISRRPDIALQFTDYVVSQAGQQILYGYGFEIPGEIDPPPTPQP